MAANLTSEQLFALQHAVRCHIERNDKLAVAMCGFFPDDKTELNAAIGRIRAEMELLENAMAIVSRMYEEHCQGNSRCDG